MHRVRVAGPLASPSSLETTPGRPQGSGYPWTLVRAIDSGARARSQHVTTWIAAGNLRTASPKVVAESWHFSGVRRPGALSVRVGRGRRRPAPVAARRDGRAPPSEGLRASPVSD